MHRLVKTRSLWAAANRYFCPVLRRLRLRHTTQIFQHKQLRGGQNRR
ncbi:MAG: hypothetical protein ACK4Q5_21210 [Saprospiraceae bacterium]